MTIKSNSFDKTNKENRTKTNQNQEQRKKNAIQCIEGQETNHER